MNNKNAEGYPDPTAATALENVARAEDARVHRPLVYIASPYAGETEDNISRAKGYCRFAVSKGVIPLAPHLLYPQFMDDSDEDQRILGLRFAISLLYRCDELWVFGEKVSAGMAKEIEKAEKRGMRIRRFNSKCEEVKVK
mgnify:FL=1